MVTQLDQTVFLSKQLLTDAILGLDFLTDYKAEISFLLRYSTLRVNEQLHSFGFEDVCKAAKRNNLDQELADQQTEMGPMLILPPNSPLTMAVCKAGQTYPTDRHHKKPSSRDKASMQVQGGEELSRGKFIPQGNNYCDQNDRFSAKCMS